MNKIEFLLKRLEEDLSELNVKGFHNKSIKASLLEYLIELKGEVNND